MKHTLALTVCLPLVILAAAVHTPPSSAQDGARAKRRQVKVYMAKILEDGREPAADNPFNIHPLTRTVDAAAPMRPALDALLAGPTSAEEKRGFVDTGFGIKLVRLRRKGATARADFHMPPGAAFSGDLSPILFKEAVERTVKQFPGVGKVTVCLDGVLDFWSESGEPPQKCPKL